MNARHLLQEAVRYAALQRPILVLSSFFIGAWLTITGFRDWNRVRYILLRNRISKFLARNSSQLQAASSLITVVVAVPTLLFIAGQSADTRRQARLANETYELQRMAEYSHQKAEDDISMPHIEVELDNVGGSQWNWKFTNNGRGDAFRVQTFFPPPNPDFETLAKGANFTAGSPMLQPRPGMRLEFDYLSSKGSRVRQPLTIDKAFNVGMLPRSIDRAYAYLVPDKPELHPTIEPGQAPVTYTQGQFIPVEPGKPVLPLSEWLKSKR